MPDAVTGRGTAAITFAEGETVRTENNHGHDTEGFRALARSASWVAGPVWTDAAGLFPIPALSSAQGRPPSTDENARRPGVAEL